jgi:iron complex transport system substrate-binding protein
MLQFRWQTTVKWLCVGLVISLSSGCRAPDAMPIAAPEVSTPETNRMTSTAIEPPSTNLTDGCVEDFDPTIDYFPTKLSLDEAEGFRVEYYNHYKVVTVYKPWDGAEIDFQYLLVQCGTPIPDGYADGGGVLQVIQIPVESVATLTTTTLPHLDTLGLLARLVAVEEHDLVTNAATRAAIETGKVAEVGGAGANVEPLLEVNPDLIFTVSTGNPVYDNHPKLQEVGLPVALVADYLEVSPLGRAEWLKYIALFFNQEAAATEQFSQVAERYYALAAQVSAVDERPTVYTGILRGDSWSMAGGQGYLARFLADAGADYLWAGEGGTASMPLSFETVYERAAEADFWLPNTTTFHSISDVLAQNERYGDFAAVQNGQVYNNTGSLSEFGGNDYWQTGIANPDLVLADLIAIFHPQLLPEHELRFYQRLEAGE